ncbi:hypothetical protein BGZ63DRAFT_429255 [Mariannaea sp. PMI_226]|nr:hypothetical protein BGZ63DRAFT_429255 [Mariannaea sp. PMI_226]
MPFGDKESPAVHGAAIGLIDGIAEEVRPTVRIYTLSYVNMILYSGTFAFYHFWLFHDSDGIMGVLSEVN